MEAKALRGGGEMVEVRLQEYYGRYEDVLVPYLGSTRSARDCTRYAPYKPVDIPGRSK